jgi:hypothetical protein
MLLGDSRLHAVPETYLQFIEIEFELNETPDFSAVVQYNPVKKSFKGPEG